MAQRRMTSLDVIDTDAFLDMSAPAQLLYFHLNARADDDGFVSNPKKVMRTLGSSSDDLKLLVAKKFIIPFEDGVCVIKHWRINNFVRKDIYTETKYLEHKGALFIRPNGAYTLTEDNRAVPVPKGHFTLEGVNDSLTKRQLSIGKGSLDKTSANAEKNKNSLPMKVEIYEEDETPDKPQQIPVARQYDIVRLWNRLPNWKATGQRNTPPNQSAIKTLLPEAKATKDLQAAILRKRSKYTLAEFEQAFRAYATEIANRTKDSNGFYKHRWSLYEFLTHKNVLERYVNR